MFYTVLHWLPSDAVEFEDALVEIDELYSELFLNTLNLFWRYAKLLSSLFLFTHCFIF